MSTVEVVEVDVVPFSQLDVATFGLSPGADGVIHIVDEDSGALADPIERPERDW